MHKPQNNPNPHWLQDKIQILSQAFDPNLLNKKYKEQPRATNTAGHCYIGSEIMFHTLGGKTSGLKSMVLSIPDGTHWFLKHESGLIIDPTYDQFSKKNSIDYSKGKPCGFLTKLPSKRAQIVMDKVKWKPEQFTKLFTQQLLPPKTLKVK